MSTPMRATCDRHGPVLEIMSSPIVQFDVNLANPTPSSWIPDIPVKETNVKSSSKARIRKNGNWSDEQLKQALQTIDGGWGEGRSSLET